MKKISLIVGAAVVSMAAQSAMATCTDIAANQAALVTAANTAASKVTGGYGLPMWITAVDENGVVCYVVTSNSEVAGGGAYDWKKTTTSGAAASNQQWLGSRVISAQKANTANAFSIDNYAISTANLYAPTQPGGSLFGLQHSNPVDTAVAYGTGNGATAAANAATFGTATDIMVGKVVGGVNVFGGGLGLYKATGTKVGAIGVSGDTSCRDHAFAWEVRKALGLDKLVYGITNFNAAADETRDAKTVTTLKNAAGGAVIGDELIISVGAIPASDVAEVTGNAYWKGWSQPACPNTDLTHASYVFTK